MTGPAPSGPAASSLPSDPADLGLLEAAALLRARKLSALELAEACLSRIDEVNGGEPTFDGAPAAINAWVRLYPELARDHARDADERLAREGDAAPLVCGIPLAVKDLYGMAGLPLTASSRVLEGNGASEDTEARRRRRAHVWAPLSLRHYCGFGSGNQYTRVTQCLIARVLNEFTLTVFT